jgi:hypothetical protein
MPGTLVARSLATSVLILQLALPLTATAHGPSECASGPTRLAGPDAPHAFDSHGTDATGVGTGSAAAAIYGDAADVIGAWISGPSAWADRAVPQKFTASIRLESLSMTTAAGERDRVPVLARYYLGFEGAGGVRWVRAVFDSPGTWLFAYGTLNGTTFTQEGDTTGSVNTSTGTITIDIPSATLPSRPSNGTSLTKAITLARSYLRYPSGVNTGSLALVDDASGFCPVTLYEKDPALP